MVWKLEKYLGSSKRIKFYFIDESSNSVSLDYNRETDGGDWKTETKGFSYSINDLEEMKILVRNKMFEINKNGKN